MLNFLLSMPALLMRVLDIDGCSSSGAASKIGGKTRAFLTDVQQLRKGKRTTVTRRQQQRHSSCIDVAPPSLGAAVVPGATGDTVLPGSVQVKKKRQMHRVGDDSGMGDGGGGDDGGD